jgi:hypothetical protein
MAGPPVTVAEQAAAGLTECPQARLRFFTAFGELCAEGVCGRWSDANKPVPGVNEQWRAGHCDESCIADAPGVSAGGHLPVGGTAIQQRHHSLTLVSSSGVVLWSPRLSGRQTDIEDADGLCALPSPAAQGRPGR